MHAASTLIDEGTAAAPICLVYGNCQAIALHEVLCRSPAFAAEYNLVCGPPVYTATADELSELQKLVARASLIVAQPVRSQHRGMALGTEEIAALAPRGCRLILFPVLYYPSLYPFQVYVHLASGHAPAPMTDVYHDLRLISCAARGMGIDTALEWFESYVPDRAGLQEVAAEVAAINHGRERQTEIKVFDRFTGSATDHRASFFTVNHPSRLTLRHVSEGVHDAVDLPFADEGTEELLDSIRTPVEEPVLSALGLPANGTAEWVIDGKSVPAQTLARAHLDLYRQRPDIVDTALNEHATLLERLGLDGARGSGSLG